MPTTLQEMLATLDPEERAHIKARADILDAEYQTLKDLREGREPPPAQVAHALDLQQFILAHAEHMAEVLDVDKDALTKYAHRGDVALLLLRTYIDALDGDLRFTVKLPGERAVTLDKFDGTGKYRYSGSVMQDDRAIARPRAQKKIPARNEQPSVAHARA